MTIFKNNNRRFHVNHKIAKLSQSEANLICLRRTLPVVNKAYAKFNEINSDIGIFFIKQTGEPKYTEDVLIKTDGLRLYIKDEKIELSQLSSGHFDSYQDPILVYVR